MGNDELRHWGVKGMRWGVRRYQNKDGTLTPAGKKRYDKEMSKLKAEEQVLKNKKKTQATLAKLDAKRKKNQELADELDPKKQKKSKKEEAEEAKTESGPSKKKSIKDMSDEELANAIRRSEMEKRYRELNPREVSKGEKIVKGLVIPVATDVGKNLAKDYLTKLGKEKLGLKGDEFEALKKATETAEFKKRKAVAEDFLKKRAEREQTERESNNSSNFQARSQASSSTSNATSSSSSNSTSSSTSTTSNKRSTNSEERRTVYEGTVMGEGTSRSRYTSSGRSWTDGPVVDAEWRDIGGSSNTTRSAGALYTANLLGLPSPRNREDD